MPEAIERRLPRGSQRLRLPVEVRQWASIDVEVLMFLFSFLSSDAVVVHRGQRGLKTLKPD